ncbi:histamine H2 receptor-like [Montipora foliosa]|uniref:histamine H2 receptor-like n=1 Tax=Montipora foliosa TaxID=591990 RepID=UPI0035F1EB20
MADVLSSRDPALTAFEVFALLILNVFSLCGNTLVCLSVYRNRNLRTTTNLYIIALAVSDLLSAVFVMPFGAGVLIASKWVFGDVFCQFHAFFSLFVIYVSPVTMGLTAVNRYVRMCRPERQYKLLFSPGRSRALLAFVWTFVACYTVVPRLFGLQAYAFVPGYAQCSISHLSESGKMIHYGIVLTLFFITPLTATAFSYFKVAKKIQQHNSDALTAIQRSRVYTGISSQEIKLSKSLFAVVFAFMVCWIPFWVIVILRRFHLVEIMPRNVELLCMFLLYFSNTINPFIYAGMNPVFKREFRKVIFCKRGTMVGVSSAGEVKTDIEANSTIAYRNAALQRQMRYGNCQEFINGTPELNELCLIVPGQQAKFTAFTPIDDSIEDKSIHLKPAS